MIAAVLSGVASTVVVLAAILAPWFHGTAYAWERRFIESLLIYGALVPVLAGLILHPPRKAALVSIFIWLTIVGGAAFLAWNARTIYDPGLAIFGTLKQPLPGWPGAVDPNAAAQGARTLLALATAWCVVIAATRSRTFRHGLWTALIVSGTAIALYGIVQRIVGTPLLVWEGKSIQRESFGPFYYHGNAASYLNVILPLAVLRAVLEIKKRRRSVAAICFAACALLCTAAALVNVSKIGQVIALLTLAGIALDQAWRYRTEFQRLPPLAKLALPVIAAVFVTLLLGIAFSNLGTKRWEEFNRKANPMAKRTEAWLLAMQLLPEAGATGLGANTFALAFESERRLRPLRVPQRWLHLHNDYLQTAIELGWLGAGLSTILAFGAVLRGFSHWQACARGKHSCTGSDFHLLRAAAIGAIGVLIHASVDFPFQMPALSLHAVILLALLWTAPDWDT